MSDDMGQLIEKGFYTEPRDFSGLTTDIALLSFFFCFLLAGPILVSRGVVDFPATLWWVLLSSVAVGAVILFTIFDIRRAFIVKNGGLDWDLYENGILKKEWKNLGSTIPEDVSINKASVPPPWKQLVRTFARFDDIAKVCLSEEATRSEKCVDLFVQYYNDDASSTQIKDKKSAMWGAAKRYVEQSVLFIGHDGRLIVRPAMKKNFKDLKAFDQLIRQNVKVVE